MTHSIYDWFNRTTGSWTSERRYIFNMKTREPVNLTTDFIIAANTGGNWDYTVEWTGTTSGTMNLRLSGNELHRDIGYFTEDPTVSQLSMIDSDTLVMVTSYDGQTFREEIRMLFNDKVRLRQTIGRSDEDDSIRLVGQYYETRNF
jgi:hypothetical protein